VDTKGIVRRKIKGKRGERREKVEKDNLSDRMWEQTRAGNLCRRIELWKVLFDEIFVLNS